MNKLPFVIIIIFFLSCIKNKKVLIIDNIKAVGYINADSTYDGLINFYDLKSNKLLYSSNYKQNILDGVQTTYYPNGKIQNTRNYSNGELNGFTNFYDTSGNLFSKQYTYYGIKAGHHINFHSGIPKEYGFYSLENELLFYINYDSLKNNKITELEDSYFFYDVRSFSNMNELNVASRKKEIFLYLINPPKYSFKYSIVQIDSNYNVVSVDTTFNNNTIWSTFSISKESTDIKPAIRLIIVDSSRTNEKRIMFKKL